MLVLAFNYKFISNRTILSRVSRANSHYKLRDSKLSWHIAVHACFLPLKAYVYISHYRVNIFYIRFCILFVLYKMYPIDVVIND